MKTEKKESHHYEEENQRNQKVLYINRINKSAHNLCSIIKWYEHAFN